MKYVNPLSDAEIETLQQMHAHHPSRRARMRAHSLLLSHQRYSIPHHGRRLNVLGFLKRNNDLYPYMIEGSVDTAVLIECFDQLSAQIDKRSYVLLDNAPMHRSKAFIQHMPQWVRKGFIVKYLPSYAPELNLSDILWRFLKYYWLPFSAYTSFQSLYEASNLQLPRTVQAGPEI